jgi:hypothetical protein
MGKEKLSEVIKDEMIKELKLKGINEIRKENNSAFNKDLD